MESTALPQSSGLTPGDIKLARLLTRPWTLAQFMTFALLDEEIGYYRTCTPLGARGDFTTAPEISPLFGESVGVHLLSAWQESGSPTPFMLAELGPGRGTLMADILRVGRLVPDFLAGAQIHLVECHPGLRAQQKQTLTEQNVTWHDTVEEALASPLPLYLVANEFFDALPIHQYEQTHEGWRERGVTFKSPGILGRVLLNEGVPDDLPDTPIGAVVERCPEGLRLFNQILTHLSQHGGRAFICDYGYETGYGDTLQGVRRHQYASVLSGIGQTDLSAHVDFGALQEAARAFPHIKCRLLTQGAFLKENFIEVRAQQLLKKAVDEKTAQGILQGLTRLTQSNTMGDLFKVLLLEGVPSCSKS